MNPTFGRGCHVYGLSRTNIIINGVPARHSIEHNLSYYRKRDDGDVEVEAPEVILEGRRVLQPEDEDVSGEDHSDQEEQDLDEDGALEVDLEGTDPFRQRAIGVPDDFNNLGNENPLERGPA